MNGRLENKIKIETHIQENIKDTPLYLQKFYHSLNSKSHTTKLRYINNIKRFLLKVYNGKYPSEDELNNIDDYVIQIYMSEIEYYNTDGDIKELKENSKCIIYSSLAAFFRFLGKKDIIDNSPFSDGKIERPKINENQIVFLTPDEVRRVEAQIISGVGNSRSVSRQNDWKYRDLLLFRIPVINGLRVTALSEINVNDVDLETRSINVIDKGNISKTVAFDVKTANYLKIWIKEREKLLNGIEQDALFISNRRTRITTRSIERLIDKYTVCIEGKHITPHKLRNTCGTNTYQVKKDINLTSKILGHKTTAPTQRYVAVFDEDKVNAINEVAALY